MTKMFTDTAHPSLACDWTELEDRGEQFLQLIGDAAEEEAQAMLKLFHFSYLGLHHTATDSERMQALQLSKNCSRAYINRMQELRGLEAIA